MRLSLVIGVQGEQDALSPRIDRPAIGADRQPGPRR
jgi:hypothetical protein